MLSRFGGVGKTFLRETGYVHWVIWHRWGTYCLNHGLKRIQQITRRGKRLYLAPEGRYVYSRATDPRNQSPSCFESRLPALGLSESRFIGDLSGRGDMC